MPWPGHKKEAASSLHLISQATQKKSQTTTTQFINSLCFRAFVATLKCLQDSLQQSQFPLIIKNSQAS